METRDKTNTTIKCGKCGKPILEDVRNHAPQVAEKEQHELILIDGAPGIDSPVIASLTGVDLERILDVTRHFGIGSVQPSASTNTTLMRRTAFLKLCLGIFLLFRF